MFGYPVFIYCIIFLSGLQEFMAFRSKYAGVAQSVEQRIRNAQVAGSSPVASSIQTRHIVGSVCLEAHNY